MFGDKVKGMSTFTCPVSGDVIKIGYTHRKTYTNCQSYKAGLCPPINRDENVDYSRCPLVKGKIQVTM